MSDIVLTSATARGQLVAALGLALPGWNIIPVGREPDSMSKPTAIVLRRTFRLDPSAPRANTENACEVWVVVPPDSTDDDALDAQADAMARALDAIPWAVRGTATRDAFDGRLPGYRIDVTVTTRYQPDPSEEDTP